MKLKMIKLIIIILLAASVDLINAATMNSLRDKNPNVFSGDNIPDQISVIKSQKRFDGNNIETWVQNTGTFNQDIRQNNFPGFMWPKGSNKYAIFSSGLSIGNYYNGSLRL